MDRGVWWWATFHDVTAQWLNNNNNNRSLVYNIVSFRCTAGHSLEKCLFKSFTYLTALDLVASLRGLRCPAGSLFRSRTLSCCFGHRLCLLLWPAGSKCIGSVVAGWGLSRSVAEGSYLPDQPSHSSSCIVRQILNHWTIRGSPLCSFFNLGSFYCWVVRLPYIFWILDANMICRIFSLFYTLSFDFIVSFEGL